MQENEVKIMDNLIQNNKLSLEVEKEYSDEFYEACMRTFEGSARKKIGYLFIKRVFDIVVSFFALLVLAIPFLIIAIVIKLDSEGPAFFRSRRIGKDEKAFSCMKFRSMFADAPPEIATSWGGVDKYITRVGRFIRKTSMDELPQLWNVLMGQMSIIGYRPLVPTEENCNAMRNKMGVFSMRPGISGLAQILGRDDVYYKNKAIMDAYYVKNASILKDLSIMLETVLVVLRRSGNKDEEK